LDGSGEFNFSVPRGATFHFQASVRHADLQRLMRDLDTQPRKVEGTLYGTIAVTSASSRDWRSWQGSGRARLKDGFLWDIPIFGFFSPVLDKVVPGLGNSPVSAGSATFEIEDSVLRTADLELKSPALRLLYSGQVDYQGRVKARMQAEILRDAWGVGRAVSLALWPLSKAFEYRISGTVQNPRSEPVYIPRILLWPFHPIRTIRRVLGMDNEKKQPAQPLRQPARPR
jgi:hypothetical protein